MKRPNLKISRMVSDWTTIVARAAVSERGVFQKQSLRRCILNSRGNFLLFFFCYVWQLSAFLSSLTDVALSSSLLCHDPNSPTGGCCSDGTVLLGGFGGSLNTNLTVSSVEYLGPDEELPPPGRTILPNTHSQHVYSCIRAAKVTDGRVNGFITWMGAFLLH